MTFDRLRQGSYRWLLAAAPLVISQPLHGDDVDPSVAALVEKLDHPSFEVRRAAARELTSMGISQIRSSDRAGFGNEGMPDGREETTSALRRAMSHQSVEVRMEASRILQEILFQAYDGELARLLNPHCEANTIRLTHWAAFAQLVGDDMASRAAFAKVSRRMGCRFITPGHDPEVDDTERWRALVERFDPFRLDAEDTTGWTVLLMLDLQGHEALHHLTPRIALSLSHCPMGPSITRSTDGIVLSRLIDRWIRESSRLCGARERLLIAMRYGRRDAAEEISRRVLEDDSATPAATVTGLLVASVLQCEGLVDRAKARLEDDRVAHVWQLIPSQKTRIRTEVRDVALAVLLHQRGVDPRSVGFEQLQADPILLFRDHSLGFADQAARSECRRRAELALAD